MGSMILKFMLSIFNAVYEYASRFCSVRGGSGMSFCPILVGVMRGKFTPRISFSI